jgi:hypothetical protein
LCAPSSGWWSAARSHACIPTGARGEAGRGVNPHPSPLRTSKVAGPLTRRPAPARWCTRRSRAWRRPQGGRRRRTRPRARSPRRRRCPCACAPSCPRCRPTARPATWRAPSRRAPPSAPCALRLYWLAACSRSAPRRASACARARPGSSAPPPSCAGRPLHQPARAAHDRRRADSRVSRAGGAATPRP